MEAKLKDASVFYDGQGSEGLKDLKERLRAEPPELKSQQREQSLLATGLAALDQVLGGGFPAGSLVELVGRQSSGVTSLASSLAASVTSLGGQVAWIDPHNTLDPQSLLEVGINAQQFLWIRPHKNYLKYALKAADTILDGGGFDLVVVDMLARRSASKNLPLSTWMRLAKRLEHRNTTCVVLRNYPGVSSAQYRLRFLGGTFSGATVELQKIQRKAVYSEPVSLPFAPPFD